MSLKSEREKLLQDLKETVDLMPDPPALNMKVIEKCTRSGETLYEEWENRVYSREP